MRRLFRMKMEQSIAIEKIVLQDDGTFPNSPFPALLYKGVLDIPMLFPAMHIKHLLEKNGWSNSWDAGVFEYHHYHSITHEVLGIYKGRAKLQLGGTKGPQIFVEKGDVLIIPAGVAHKNLGAENAVGVIGAYPGGRDYDINYGKPGERPGTDRNISKVPVPATDPIGISEGLIQLWK
jgi:uncharacterized protein YjlB